MAKSLEEAFAFSPYTGNELVNKDGVLVDEEAGQHHFLNPKPTVFVVIYRDGGDEILLVKRGVEPAKGMWDLPGGFIQLHETLEQGLVRECREELGIELDESKLVYMGSYLDTYPYQDIAQELINVGYMLDGSTFENLKVMDDIAGYEWVRVEEIDWEMICGKSVEGVLRDFMKKGLE